MALTGAQLKKALSSVGGGSGMVASADQLAAGANDAMRRVGCKTVTECALFLATLAQESAYFRTATEYGSGQRYAPYIGRGFEQVTWRANYAAYGAWAKSKGLVSDANLFVNQPTRLADSAHWWMTGVWYWTIPRSWGQYTSLIDAARKTGSIWTVSRAVNAGDPNSSITPWGMNERIKLFDAFKALGSSIVPGSTSTPTSSPASVPPEAIPASVATVTAAMTALYNRDKGVYWGNGWRGWRELPDGISSGAWCAAFIQLGLIKACGYNWGKYCSAPAYTVALDQWMRRSPMFTQTSYASAREGDIVFFLNSAGPYHVEYVRRGPSSSTSHDMQTIGGNTSTPGISQSLSSGGTAAMKTRDDRYLKLRIWRPTYVSATETPTDATPPVEDDAPAPSGRPTLDMADIPDAPLTTMNPIDELRVSEAFVESLHSSAAKVCKVDAYLGRDLILSGLPVVASASKIAVDASTSATAVRRQASLEFALDRWGGAFRDLWDVLAYPGMRLRVRSGFSWGGAEETVPVGEFLCDDPQVEWPSGRIKVEAPDTMALVGMCGFGGITNFAGYTHLDVFRWLIAEADAGAGVIDLSGGLADANNIPFITKDATPTARIDMITELAASIGCEIFKSPVAGLYVVRPVQTPGVASRWTTRVGQDLTQVTKQAKNSSVKNEWHVVSERADQGRGRGIWRDTNPDSATRVDGPFGRRTGIYTTSLIDADDREALELMAAALGARTMGSAVDISWKALANPLMEGGDAVDVITDEHAYGCVVDRFDIPLGAQRVTDAQARSLTIPGVTT